MMLKQGLFKRSVYLWFAVATLVEAQSNDACPDLAAKACRKNPGCTFDGTTKTCSSKTAAATTTVVTTTLELEPEAGGESTTFAAPTTPAPGPAQQDDVCAGLAGKPCRTNPDCTFDGATKTCSPSKTAAATTSAATTTTTTTVTTKRHTTSSPTIPSTFTTILSTLTTDEPSTAGPTGGQGISTEDPTTVDDVTTADEPSTAGPTGGQGISTEDPTTVDDVTTADEPSTAGPTGGQGISTEDPTTVDDVTTTAAPTLITRTTTSTAPSPTTTAAVHTTTTVVPTTVSYEDVVDIVATKAGCVKSATARCLEACGTFNANGGSEASVCAQVCVDACRAAATATATAATCMDQVAHWAFGVNPCAADTTATTAPIITSPTAPATTTTIPVATTTPNIDTTQPATTAEPITTGDPICGGALGNLCPRETPFCINNECAAAPATTPAPTTLKTTSSPTVPSTSTTVSSTVTVLTSTTTFRLTDAITTTTTTTTTTAAPSTTSSTKSTTRTKTTRTITSFATIKTTTTTTMATTTKVKAELFYCDPQDASTDCTCPSSLGCGKLGSCKQAFASNPDRLICDTCSEGFVGTTTAKTKRCLKSFVCKAGKIVTPPKYAGESCKCNDQNCNWCETTAVKETCKTCKNSKYLFGAACYNSCDVLDTAAQGLVAMGTGAYKRRCFANPFTCIKGYFHNSTTGDRIEKPYGCKCPNKEDSKYEPNCHTCDFKAGLVGTLRGDFAGHGVCTICKGKTFLHNNECVRSCKGTGLVGYLPSGKGGVCRESFSCVGGVDQSDGESICICPKKLAYCKSCTYGDAGAACTECEGKRPYLHDGICRKECPKGNPAPQDESQGKQCS